VKSAKKAIEGRECTVGLDGNFEETQAERSILGKSTTKIMI